MFGIKSVYFYLIALQITLIRLLKKVYFSSNHYNKSLQTKVPQQVYYSPNPFLLSIITPYKKKSFQINEIDPNFFWLKEKNKNQEDLHNFFWLNLIDRKIDAKNLKKIIYIWMLKYSKYQKRIWDSSILGSRVISWILNIDIILNNSTFDFKKKFLNSIVAQSNHLKKNIRFEKDFSKKIEVLSALILSGLVFKEYEENYKIGIKELETLVKKFFDSEGFPLTRNPNDLIFFTRYLIFCREIIKDGQEYVPEFLEIIIEKNLTCIKFIKSTNDDTPLFNGASENKLDQFDEFIESQKKEKITNNTLGGLFKIKLKNHLIFFDVGGPPKKSFSKSYQSGPLSFEYYLDGVKIITNCGFGNNISNKAELLSRLTACQSTLTLNDTTVTKFERNKLINRVFGNSIKNSFETYDVNIKDEKDLIGCSVSHNGYEKNFGCTHRREIYLDKKNNYIKGCDHIVKRKDGMPIRYVFRFHINPKLTVVKTINGNSALIQISKNKSLLFTVKDEALEVEKSIYLGRKKIVDNPCITIIGNLVNKNKLLNWEIKKNL